MCIPMTVTSQTSDIEKRLNVVMVTDEADAVIAILEKLYHKNEPSQADWSRLFSSEGYKRLKKRELSMKRRFDDSLFKSFLYEPGLTNRLADFKRTLWEWKAIDMQKDAQMAFDYLPADAVIRAKIYPVIKPAPNSFVFETNTDPAIFIYLDPKISPRKLDNIVAHELHHIGTGSICRGYVWKKPENVQAALYWMTGFAEGRAVLAAAGGRDIHPHESSDAADRSVWDRDYAKAEEDMRQMEDFYFQVLNGELESNERQRNGMAFIGNRDVPQGPFYTVGYLMSSTVERVLGRQRLIDSFCDPAMFLSDYNKAADELNRTENAGLPLWSEKLISAIK